MFETSLATDEQWRRWLDALRHWPSRAADLQSWASNRLACHHGAVDVVLSEVETLQAWPELQDRLSDQESWTLWVNAVAQEDIDAETLGSLAVDRLDTIPPAERSPTRMQREVMGLVLEYHRSQDWKAELSDIDLKQRDRRGRRSWMLGIGVGLAAAAGLVLVLGNPLQPGTSIEPGSEMTWRGSEASLIPTVRVASARQEPIDLAVGRGVRPELLLGDPPGIVLEQVSPELPGRTLVAWGVNKKGDIRYLDGEGLLELPLKPLALPIESDVHTIIVASLPDHLLDEAPERSILDGRQPLTGLRGEIFILAIDLRGSP